MCGYILCSYLTVGEGTCVVNVALFSYVCICSHGCLCSPFVFWCQWLFLHGHYYCGMSRPIRKFATCFFRCELWYNFHLDLLKKSISSSGFCDRRLSVVYDTYLASSHNTALCLWGGQRFIWGRISHSCGMLFGATRSILAMWFCIRFQLAAFSLHSAIRWIESNSDFLDFQPVTWPLTYWAIMSPTIRDCPVSHNNKPWVPLKGAELCCVGRNPDTVLGITTVYEALSLQYVCLSISSIYVR